MLAKVQYENLAEYPIASRPDNHITLSTRLPGSDPFPHSLRPIGICVDLTHMQKGLSAL